MFIDLVELLSSQLNSNYNVSVHIQRNNIRQSSKLYNKLQIRIIIYSFKVKMFVDLVEFLSF